MAETKTTIPVEIKMGNAGTNDANLPAFKEGSIIFTKDTKKIYIDPVGETERIEIGGTEVDLSGKQDKFCNISAIPAGMNNYILKLSDFGFWDEEQNKYHTLDADNQRIISISANGNSFDFREDVRVKGLSLDKGNGAILSFKPTDTNNHFEISSSDNSNVIFDIFKNSSLTMNMPTTTTNIPGFILNCGVGFTVTAQNFQLYSPYGRIHVGDGKNGDARIIGVKDGVSDNDAVNVSQLNSKQDKFATIEDTTNPYLILNFDSDGYVQTNLNINYPIIKDTSSQDKVKIDSKNFSIGETATGGVEFKAGSNNGDSFKITTGVMTDSAIPTIQFTPAINSSGNTGVVRLTGIAAPTADNDAVNRGYLTTKYGSTYYESQDKQYYLPSGSNMVIPNSNMGRLFIGSESAASTDFKIYINDPLDDGKLIITNLKTPANNEDAANKKYVDDIKTELLNAITHPYTYDETTKELTLIL